MSGSHFLQGAATTVFSTAVLVGLTSELRTSFQMFHVISASITVGYIFLELIACSCWPGKRKPDRSCLGLRTGRHRRRRFCRIKVFPSVSLSTDSTPPQFVRKTPQTAIASPGNTGFQLEITLMSIQANPLRLASLHIFINRKESQSKAVSGHDSILHGSQAPASQLLRTWLEVYVKSADSVSPELSSNARRKQPANRT